MNKAPILHLPDFSKDFVLRTYAINEGLGAVLTQEHNGDLHPVAYTLNVTKKNYTTSETECFGIEWVIQNFHAYLSCPGNSLFRLIINLWPIWPIQTKEIIHSLLQRYHYIVEVKHGTDSVGKDFLSQPVKPCDTETI